MLEFACNRSINEAKQENTHALQTQLHEKKYVMVIEYPFDFGRQQCLRVTEAVMVHEDQLDTNDESI